jgi:O-antigen/teichoic acid export membrane protein
MSVNVDVANNNKRMLKNTFVLYVRMAFTMGIGFFTTRELLVALGVVDFGLANVIGSVVLMFSFLSGTMQATVSRYLSTDIGLKNGERLRQTFNLTLLMYVALVVVVVILSESIGLWFLENKLVIASGRRDAAYWFYQYSIAAFVFSIFSVPYSSLIISHENIKAYAWVGTAESIARLVIVFLLYFGGQDRLSLYGGLLFATSFLTFLSYLLYCNKCYVESRLKFYWDTKRCKEMLLFASWNLWGALSGLFSNVFLNVLLNSYFGPVVNAARGIAMQGATGVSNFVTNFLTAARPQIFKYYAEGNKHLAVDLSVRSARAGYFLLFFFSLPVLLEMPFILALWLEEVPEDADLFMRLILIQRLVDILAYPLVTLSQACGRVALYQTIVGVLQWAVFPISWVALDLGFGASSVFWVGIALSACALAAQFYLINMAVPEFSVERFVKEAVYPALLVSAVSTVIPVFAYVFLSGGWLRFIVVCTVSCMVTLLAIYGLGLVGGEREMVRSYFSRKLGLSK